MGTRTPMSAPVAGSKKIQPTRLYAKGVMMGFKRGLRNQYEHTSILKIQNVNDKDAVEFYLGKRVCFIYKAQKEIRGSKFRTIWGRVTRPHGSTGAVRAKFQQPSSQGHRRTSTRDALPLARLNTGVGPD